MKPTEKEKKAVYRKWWWTIFPVGGLALVTAPVFYPLAEIEKHITGTRLFWYWLDDLIYDPEENDDWNNYMAGLPKWLIWFKYYWWHAIRNTMYNLKAKLGKFKARINCIKNEEVIVEIVKFNMTLNGRNLTPEDLCLNMPVVRWVDKLGNDGWNILSGVKVNDEKSIWGDMEIWYMANGVLLFREGYVEQGHGWMLHNKFPFIGKKDYYHIVAKGYNEKRAIYTDKKQLKP